MIDWSPLRTALTRCRASKTPIPIWWRDDDAIEPTPALDRLNELSANLGVPVHLAVIPKQAGETLVPYVEDRPNLIPCIHGWTHQNTAPSGHKKSEFGVPRNDGFDELVQAKARMIDLFGTNLFPLFVPPWNRFDLSFEHGLKQAEYVGFSTFGPRTNTITTPQINTHIDPIFWRGHRGLVEPERLIRLTAEILDARCNGIQDSIEPLGFLTHHLVHIPEVWTFCWSFMTEMLDGGAYPANLKEILK